LAIQGDSQESSSGEVAALDADAAAVEEMSSTEEMGGSPGRNADKEGLMHTVMDGDSNNIDLGNMVLDSTSNGASFFTPELLMEKLVKDYRSAEQIIGPSLIRRLTGFEPGFVQKNVNIPEFRRELEKQIRENVKDLKDKGVLNKDGSWSNDALELAAVVLATQELDHLSACGILGRRVHKQRSVSGTREETKPFTNDPYRSLSIQQSVKTALRRGHTKIVKEDLKAFDRQARGGASIVYAIDASGSMKGAKIAQAKKAGVALAYKAIQNGDKVGLVVFEKTVQASVAPTRDFSLLLSTLTRLRPGSETDLAESVRVCSELFSGRADTQHIILLTDALPTIGSDPDARVLDQVALTASVGISVSVIGIGLDKQGETLARKIVALGNGRLSVVSDVSDLDIIILEEYDRIRS